MELAQYRRNTAPIRRIERRAGFGAGAVSGALPEPGDYAEPDIVSTPVSDAPPRWIEVEFEESSVTSDDVYDHKLGVARWRWLLDHRLIGSVAAMMLVSLAIAMSLNGMLGMVDDPDGALPRSSSERLPMDTSVGVELRVIPNHPLGLEFRKIGEDEEVVLFSRSKVVTR